MRPATRAELLRAWMAWDSQPCVIAAAHAMEDACQAAARELGCPCTRLRGQVSAARREGVSRVAAIDHAVRAIEAEQSGGNGDASGSAD